MLTFDAASHTYRHGSEVIPSVTQVLGMLTDLSMIPRRHLDYARDRGDAVHYACELDDRGELDEATVDRELAGYLEGWRKFKRQTDLQVELIEHRMFHPVMRYAGTTDRVGIIYGKPAILDIKAVAQTYPTTGPQLAAYEHLRKAEQPDGPKAYDRYAVQLMPDGKYKLHQYHDRADLSVFMSALTLLKWANSNKQRISYEP